MNQPISKMGKGFPGWIPLLSGTAAYYAIGRLGILLASLNGNISPVWPATGLAIWLLLIRGNGMAAAVAIAHFLVSMKSNLPIPVALGMAAGGVIEALMGAWLWRMAQARWQKQLGDYVTLAASLVVALGPPLAAASAGTLSLFLGKIIPVAAVGSTWITWWVGDALGALFVVPVLLSAPELGHWLRRASQFELARGLIVLTASAFVCGLAFFLPDRQGLVFGIFPVLLLAALWINAPLGGWLTWIILAAAIAGTTRGLGPFSTGNLNQDLINMQVFLVSAAIMAQLFPHFRGRGYLLPSVVLLLGWALSGAIFTGLRQNQIRSDEANFDSLIAHAGSDIESRLITYIDALRSGAGLVLASKSVERDEWKIFAETMDLPNRYPGINGIGIVYPVRQNETENFLQRVRADGAPEFAIRPFPGASPITAEDHYVITALEPDATNHLALGLDLATETVRREAADAARDTGGPQMTGRLTLVQDSAKRPGFLLYLPVYRAGAALTTVAERQAALHAWIYAPFINENFMQGILGRRSGILELHFFEQGPLDPAHLLYSTTPKASTWTSFKRVRQLNLAGQTFSLGWNPGPTFKPASQSSTVFISLILAFGTLLLASLVRSLQNFRQRAEELAAEKTLELREEITQREQTDRTLREVSSFQSAIMESAKIAIVSTTPDGVIRTINPAGEQMLGYTEAELVGRQSPALFHDPAEVVARAAEFGAELGCTIDPGFDVFVIKSCRDLPNEHEWTYIRKDGSRLPVLLSITAIRDSSGNFVGFLGLAMDISERKKASAVLQQERNLMRTLIDNLPACIFVKDPAGQYLLSNKAHAESLGVKSAVDVIGKTMNDFFPLAVAQNFSRSDQAVLTEGRSFFEEEEPFERNGARGYFAVTKIPLRDAQNQVVAIVGIKHDVTARKAYEVALLTAQKTAESASKAKSEFLAVMSHEIRTPMNAVIGFTELLMDTPLQNKQRDFVEIIRSSGQNLIALINDILDFSKIEAGKLEIECIRLDGVVAVESVVNTLSLQAKAKGLWLTVEAAPEAPRILHADPSRLRQVLINFIGNALKFTARGGITITVAPAQKSRTPALRITVTDTGIGIPLEKQAQLFQKFSQADSSITREFGGTGLGLAICKRLVELMGGQIGLSSVAGQGSSFWYELPLSPDQTPLESSRALTNQSPPKSPAPAAAAPTTNTAKRRVLVADDNLINQQLVRVFLSKLDCESVVANNGQEAVKIVQTEAIDLVLMDHQMPILDGCEATKIIRDWEQAQGRTYRIPILALTANAAGNGDSYYLAAGMDGCLIKPLLFGQLKESMAGVFSRTLAVPKVLTPNPKPPLPAIQPPSASPLATSQPTPASNQIMNRARALEFVDQDPVLLSLLANAFAAQSEELIAGLTLALTTRDAKSLRQQAHKLKGSVSSFGADRVWQAARAIEGISEPPDWVQLETQVAQLTGDVRQLREELGASPTPA